ncbi:MAG TPA: fumarylacetoacetate hydrolase family protein, partial [Terracidiphilus sp.]|nr:fumarylacetoacetate hydrolase family protein [Terracidiphilus sp.]
MGGPGLHLQTRSIAAVVQDASTGDMVFSAARLLVILSEAMTLPPGDIIVSGTPAGVGSARKPPLEMKYGNVCEIEIEGTRVLRHTVKDEQAPRNPDASTEAQRQHGSKNDRERSRFQRPDRRHAAAAKYPVCGRSLVRHRKAAALSGSRRLPGITGTGARAACAAPTGRIPP